MKVSETIISLQAVLGVPPEKRAPRIGPLTRAAFERLAVLPPESEYGGEKTLPVADEVGRHINDAGLELVKHFESCSLDAYKDEVGVWTIGWGHTGLQHKDGTVFKGRVITQAKADELLQYDMRQFEARVNAHIKAPLNSDQFSALVSFDFNTGGLTLENGNPSTLTILVNADNLGAAENEFLKWDHAGGVVLRGLTRRRKSERNLFVGKHPCIVEA